MTWKIKELTLRKWHRNSGIILGLLILFQAVSGLFISFTIAFTFHHDVSASLDAHEAHTLHYAWDYLFMSIHYGTGWVTSAYHLVVGVGLVWLICTGTMIFLRGVRRSRQARRQASSS